MGLQKDTVLAVKALSKYYPPRFNWLQVWLLGNKKDGFKALEEISFCVKSGEVVAVIDEAGHGISALRKILTGTEKPTSGALNIAGEIYSLSQHVSRQKYMQEMRQATISLVDETVLTRISTMEESAVQTLKDAQRATKNTLLLFSHNLNAARHLADRIVILYLGHVVEQGTVAEILMPPYHPYTEGLLAATK